MTLDERLNKLEDSINKIAATINHNNKIFRQQNDEAKKRLAKLEKLDKQISSFMNNPFEF